MNYLAFSWRSWFSTIHDTLPRSSISGPARTGITSNLSYRHHDSAVEYYVHGIANDLLPTRLKLSALHESQGDRPAPDAHCRALPGPTRTAPLGRERLRKSCQTYKHPAGDRADRRRGRVTETGIDNLGTPS